MLPHNLDDKMAKPTLDRAQPSATLFAILIVIPSTSVLFLDFAAQLTQLVEEIRVAGNCHCLIYRSKRFRLLPKVELKTRDLLVILCRGSNEPKQPLQELQ